MVARYQLRVKDTDGAVQVITDAWRSLSYTRRVNTVGFSRLEMYIDSSIVDALALDSIIEIWRRDLEHDIDWYIDGAFFHRGWDERLYPNGMHVLFSYGQGFESILGRPHIMGFAGTAYTDKSGPAESVCKELAVEQMVTSAIARSWPPFTVEADLGRGRTVAGSYHWRNILTVMQGILDEEDTGDFSVDRVDDYEFQFNWHYPHLGDDKTVGNVDGNVPVVLSVEHGTISEPIYVKSHTAEKNAIIVAGQGQQSDRALVTVENVEAVEASPLNRCEYFQDARNISDPDGLYNRGRAELEARQAREVLHLKVNQTPGLLYGRDYVLGDLVTCRFRDVVVDKKIVGVTITLDPSSGERIDVETADIP